MALTPGTRLGVYQVTAPLGEGGMGQVWRARDTTLNRDVALKVLPDSFANDAGRLARFAREAQTLAALNHPNIAHIYGLEESGGVRALVMELVEGEELSQLIARGAISFDDALPIAKQIAQALEAAHEQGIVHRDLKPANIMVRADGAVKVLDFGLAKAMDTAAAASTPHASQLPTITSPAHLRQGYGAANTEAGIILGTAAYMSPEQARGKAVDKRGDIWSFGCILYEMLTARRTFPNGETMSDTLAGVLTREPDWPALPARTPPRVRVLLERCLTKDPRQRLRDIGDARLEIEEAHREPALAAVPSTAASSKRGSRRRDYAFVAIAMCSLAAAGIIALRPAPLAQVSAVVRFDLTPPEGTSFGGEDSFTYAATPFPILSPDGRTLAFVATSTVGPQIWIRPMDASTAQVLRGTEGAVRPFWSPAGDSIAFFAQEKLKKVPIGGGPVQVVGSQSTGVQAGGTWSSEGVLLWGQNPGPLQRVSSAGGQPTEAIPLDESRREIAHHFPHFLPDGRHFTVVVMSADPRYTGTFIGTLDSNERRALTGIGSEAVYAPTGHMLFLRDRTLMAQAFNLDLLELRGEAVPVADQITADSWSGAFSAGSGALAYRVGHNIGRSKLAWFDRSGKTLGLAGPEGDYTNIDLSPDGQFVAFQTGRPADVWVLEIQTGLVSRVTSHPAGDGFPLWSADGRSIVFRSSRDDRSNLYRRAVGVVGADELLLKGGDVSRYPTDLSSDGRFLVFVMGVGGAGTFDIWALPLSGDPTPVRITETPFHEVYAQVSPDGRWIAYASNDSSARYEVIIQSFPGRGARQQVSAAGGITPRWSADGRELYFVAPDATLMAVTLEPAGSTLKVGVPKALFRTKVVGGGVYAAGLSRQYDVGSDGRFLIQEPSAETGTTTPITVVLNWAAGLKH